MARLSAADRDAAIILAGLYRAAARITTSREADQVACEIAGFEDAVRTYRSQSAVSSIQDQAEKINARVVTNNAYLAAHPINRAA